MFIYRLTFNTLSFSIRKQSGCLLNPCKSIALHSTILCNSFSLYFIFIKSNLWQNKWMCLNKLYLFVCFEYFLYLFVWDDVDNVGLSKWRSEWSECYQIRNNIHQTHPDKFTSFCHRSSHCQCPPFRWHGQPHYPRWGFGGQF